MSIQINIGDHVSAFPGDVEVKNKDRDNFRWARIKAKAIARSMRTANASFIALPRGRSLTAMLGDNSIWINFNPVIPHFGEAGGSDIAVGKSAIQIGKWTILATIIHELAHLNGAPGGHSKQAEGVLIACGLGKRAEFSSGIDDPHTPYNPSIQG